MVPPAGGTLAGKSTLLQILAGKRLVTADGAVVQINGKDVFRNTPEGLTFLGTEWAMNPVVRCVTRSHHVFCAFILSFTTEVISSFRIF
jgi:ABC-type transport system involved in cytochrome c biogenesis ATPase subunit